MSGLPKNDPALRADVLANEMNAGPEGLLREYLAFLRHTKKWWLTPILLALLVARADVVT